MYDLTRAATLTRVTEDDLDRHARAAETKKRRTRQRITAATLALFDPGTLRTLPTLEKIAEEAGIGVATLYSHFNTKYDLYLEVLTQLFDPLVRPIRTAVELNAYKPADLRAEIVSYVCQAAILGRNYRYLVAAYIQAYFENQQYDRHFGYRLSQPVADGLAMMISAGHEPFDRRFDIDGVDAHMDNLLIACCMRTSRQWGNLPLTTRDVARGVLDSLLPSVDNTYTKDDRRSVGAQINRIIPEEDRAL
jgi:AcrR family transcriptional regulator